MLYYSRENLSDRYSGVAEVDPDSPAYSQLLALADRHFQLAHRHKISLIDDYTPIEQMNAAWLDRLSGDLFTADRGYDGVGIGVGNNVYSIGTYQSWPWTDDDEADMWKNTDAWVNWFADRSLSTPTDTFLYLIDEPESSDETPIAEQWANWMNNNPGPGGTLMSMVTISLPGATTEAPSVDIPAFWGHFGLTRQWERAAENYRDVPGKGLYAYNGTRPATGSFAIEDDGIALRVLAWTQYKMGIDRWFYWESTYYDNFQADMGPTNIFQKAHTYGSLDDVDDTLGETGWNYLNGDGVLMYPGMDNRFQQDSYDLMGPLASLRLKQWRRGIQDVDYLALAAAIDLQRTTEIVAAMVPKVLWEVGVSDPEDPTWVLTDVSWSADPDLWEAARAELADLIERAGNK
jgi:hypothetical protein